MSRKSGHRFSEKDLRKRKNYCVGIFAAFTSAMFAATSSR
jgi:hypothetical protein